MDPLSSGPRGTIPVPSAIAHPSSAGTSLAPLAAGLAALAGALVLAYLVSRENYLLFHTAVEMFRAVTAFCVFTIAWNSRGLLKSGNIWFLGVSYACTGLITLLHMLAYKGMGVFSDSSADLATQLWVASRGLEALALCIAAYTPNRRFPPGITVVAVGAVTLALLVSIFGVPIFGGAFFPDCYIEGVGLTPFKKASEYAAVGLFALAFIGLRAKADQRPSKRRALLQASVIGNAAASLAFSLYVDVYGVSNFAGHALVLAADILIFVAFVRSGIKRPQELVFWTLERDRRALEQAVERQNVQILNAEAELEQGHAELEETRQALDAVRARETAILDAVGDGILCLDQDGRVSFANGAAVALLGDHGLRVGQPLPPPLSDLAAAHGPVPADRELPRPGSAERRILEVTARPFAQPAGGASVLVIRDVTERRGFEQEAARHAEAMKRSLFETIAVVAQIITIRDPYTAGHQQRVADLAAAIAREMGLAEDEVTGIHLAGTVHDIGKISIPAEILNRPGRLSQIEYDMLKTHAQAGYDIMKNADLPWPIADMIHQHHEKLDGSGYPRGLTGDRIIRGARILAVADIIEAMASHRPYRPALGVDAALAEVERGAGITLDAEAVSACLRLFRTRGFTLTNVDWDRARATSLSGLTHGSGR